MIKPQPLLRPDRMPQRDQAHDKTRRQQRIQRRIEDVPKPQIPPPDLPHLARLVADEPGRHEIQHALHHVQIPAAVDGVDGGGVEAQKQQTEEDLHGVLVHGRAHAVRVQVRPVGRRGARGPGDEVGGVRVVLDEPAAPEVGDAALVARGADDAEGVLVHGCFDHVGGGGGDGGEEGRVAF